MTTFAIHDGYARAEMPATDALVSVDANGEAVFNLRAEHPLIRRARLLHFKDQLLSLEGAQTEFEVDHIVGGGMYMRVLRIPKGQVLVGKIHRKSCMNIVTKGDITLMTELGKKRVQAGFRALSKPGTMKVGFAHEDTEFINVFRTDETDIAKIEAEIACESHDLVPLKEEVATCLSHG
jgi:hypothetical protein